MKRAQWSENLAVAKNARHALLKTLSWLKGLERRVLSQENAPGTHRTVASTSTVVCP